MVYQVVRYYIEICCILGGNILSDCFKHQLVCARCFTVYRFWLWPGFLMFQPAVTWEHPACPPHPLCLEEYVSLLWCFWVWSVHMSKVLKHPLWSDLTALVFWNIKISLVQWEWCKSSLLCLLMIRWKMWGNSNACVWQFSNTSFCRMLPFYMALAWFTSITTHFSGKLFFFCCELSWSLFKQGQCTK